MLDDKRPEVQAQLDDAPLMVDRLSDSTRAHYDAVRQYLTDLGVTWTEAPGWCAAWTTTRGRRSSSCTRLGSQSAIGGGGRYDGLRPRSAARPLRHRLRARGRPDALAVEAEGLDIAAVAGVQAFVVPLGAEAKRPRSGWSGSSARPGSPADTVYGDRGLKGAMKAADRSGAPYVVVLGDRDLRGRGPAARTCAPVSSAPSRSASCSSGASERGWEVK